MHNLQNEIDLNYDAFVALLPELVSTHRDKYVLMKNTKVLGFYSSALDARTAAETFISDKLYSIQKVTDAPVDLGFFSHALHSNSLQS